MSKLTEYAWLTVGFFGILAMFLGWNSVILGICFGCDLDILPLVIVSSVGTIAAFVSGRILEKAGKLEND